jgi:hypothetical protein
MFCGVRKKKYICANVGKETRKSEDKSSFRLGDLRVLLA